jgi:hypothetical protein
MNRIGIYAILSKKNYQIKWGFSPKDDVSNNLAKANKME